ncbi:hypothetical protein ACLKA6_010776 [Drosophila palustris]
MSSQYLWCFSAYLILILILSINGSSLMRKLEIFSDASSFSYLFDFICAIAIAIASFTACAAFLLYFRQLFWTMCQYC